MIRSFARPVRYTKPSSTAGSTPATWPGSTRAARTPTGWPYIYTNYIGPALEPVGRLLEHLVAEGRIRPISVGMFHFIVAHGAGAPFTLAPLARHFDSPEPSDAEAVRAYADVAADLVVRALEMDGAEQRQS